MDTRQVHQKVSQVAVNISAMSPGTTISHLVLCEMLEVDRIKEPQRYYHLIAKVKIELIRQHGVFLQTEHKVGYAICLPGEEIDLCEGEYTAGYNKMRRAAAKSTLIPIAKITDLDKRRKTIERAQAMTNCLGLLRLGGEQKAFSMIQE